MTGNEVLAGVLLALAVLLGLATWLPQAPDSVTDPIAFSRWLSEMQPRLGNSFTLLRQVGLFTLERGPLLRVLLGVAALCLAMRLLDSLQAIWQARRFDLPSRPVLPQVRVEASLDNLAATLQKKRFHIVREGDAFRADRFPLAHVGRIAVYLGALVILIGLAVTSAAGWQANHLTLGIGQVAPIGHGTPYSLRLDSLDSAHIGQIALLRETDLISKDTASPNRPMRSAGLAVSITTTGPAIRASATFTNGQPLRLQASATAAPATELLLLLTNDEPDRFFAAPEAGLVVRLSRGTGNFQAVRAQVYRSRTGTVIFEGDVPSDGQVSVAEGVHFTFSPETYAILNVVRDPGQPVTLMGIGLLALGMVLTAVWPVKTLWAFASPDGTQLIGDVAVAQDESRTTPGERVFRILTSAGWQVGWAVLSVVIGIAIASGLIRTGGLWPIVPTTSALLAAWLMGCALVLLPYRASRWATLALAVLVLATVMIWPGVVLPPR